VIRQAFRDPRVLWAYIGTKAGVVVIAAIATWPLARLMGPKAWIGFGVFVGLLTIITLAVLFGGSVAERGKDQSSRSDAATDTRAPADPDLVVELPVEDSIDLHSFPPRDVPDVVDAYLEVAAKKGFPEVRLIHGRGIGVQRDRVQKLLARHPLVSGFHDAPPDRGGWGATVVYLKRKA
jgi:hypothetical protein